MKRIFFIILCLSLAGCISTTPEPVIAPVVRPPAIKIILSLDSISEGMSLEEVRQALASSTPIGYQRSLEDPESYEAVSVDQPYRREEFTKRGRLYQVWFYFTQITKADGVITDDELTPLIFERSALVGKGWNDLYRLRRR